MRLIQELEGLPCLIVCPNVVRYHWEEEVKRFWLGEPPNIRQYQGDRHIRRNLPDVDVLIVNYEMFRNDFNDYFYNKKYRMTIFDEAHRLKNSRAKVTQAAYKLNTDFIHLITGTPITNQFDDLYSYFRLLFPDQFKNYWHFVNKYGVVVHNGFGQQIVGIRQDRLPHLKKLLHQFSIRRTKKEVLPHLPDKQYTTIQVDLKSRQRSLYNELRELMIVELGNDIVEVPNIVTQLLRLRQIALSPQLVGLPCNDSAKLDALLEILLDERLPAKKQTVVMTEFRRWIDLIEPILQKKGIRTVRITGDESQSQQRISQQLFQRGDADVALCTIKAAGVGIDLTAADMTIFTDLSWTDVDNKQAEDRIHRATQRHSAQIVRLFARNTVDKLVLDRTILKALTAKKVLGGTEKEHLKRLLSA